MIGAGVENENSRLNFTIFIFTSLRVLHVSTFQMVNFATYVRPSLLDSNYKRYSLVHPYASRRWNGSSFVFNGASFVFVSTSRRDPCSSWLLVVSGAVLMAIFWYLLVLRGFWLMVEKFCQVFLVLRGFWSIVEKFCQVLLVLRGFWLIVEEFCLFFVCNSIFIF